jgi:hypothetical protein
MTETKKRLRLSRKASADPEKVEAEYAKSKLRVYLLLSAIQSMVTENPEIVMLLQNFGAVQDRPPPVEYLLFIGICADESSMVATAAFKLVRVIAYGVEPDGWEVTTFHPDEQSPKVEDGPPPMLTNEAFIQIVKRYAPGFLYSYPPTSQMVVAFPIFWNIRYPDLTSELGATDVGYPPLEYHLLVPAGCEPGPDDVWRYQRPPGLTPLELYGHLLLFDPPAREALNRGILGILNWYEMACRPIRRSDADPDFETTTEKYYMYQRAVLEKDVVFLDFLRTKFYYNEEEPSADMRVVAKSFPLDPTHDFFYRCETTTKYRVPLNGAIAAFTDLWTNAGFFEFPSDRSPMCDEEAASVPDLALQVTNYLRLTRDFDHNKMVTPSREEADALLRPKSPSFAAMPLPDVWHPVDAARSINTSPEQVKQAAQKQQRTQAAG